MRCTQTNCGKSFVNPLELYNGALVCPYCKKELTIVSDFKLTPRNQELYTLSELYLHRYLSPNSQTNGKGAVLNMMPEEMLNLAIENCRQSAEEGNPFATYRMGYYNEYFCETKRSENDRVRVAFNYYASLCYCQVKKPKVEENATSMTEDDFALLKRQAGIALLNLYNHYSTALKGTTKYDYEKNKQRLIAQYGDLGVEENVARKRSANHVKSVFKVLCSCLAKKRAPLCGLFLITGEEFKSLFNTKKYEKDKKPYLIKLIAKGVELRYLPCDADGSITKDIEDRYFINLSSEDRVKQTLLNINEQSLFYLYLFKPKGGHQFLSGSQIRKVNKKLAKNSYEAVCSLIDYSQQEYLFFDDDIVVFKKGANIEKCVDMLIEKICEDDE